MSLRGGVGETAPAFRHSLLAMLGLSLVLMLSALDQTVVSNALPRIASELHGFDRYTWVATSYLLTSVISIPIAGRLGDHYGRKPFVLIAAAIFILASLGCGAARSMGQLIVARCWQGIGGGILIGTAFACIPELFPDTRQRLRWQMLLSMAFSVVNAVGPLLGGVLTEDVSWRWVFYLNLPLGLLAIGFVYGYLPWVRPMGAQPVGLDWRGACWLTVLLAAGQGAVQWPPHRWVLAGLAAVALAILCRLQPRTAHPLLPPAMFADVRLRSLFGVSMLAGAIMFSLLFYLPLLLQAGYAYSPREAGLLITPLVLCITLGAILNGRIVSRVNDPRWLPLTGFMLLLTACAGLAIGGQQAGQGWLLGATFAAGLGLGLILMNLTLFTQVLAQREHLGIATAVSQALRLVGGMVGASITGQVVDWVYPILLGRHLRAAHLEHWISHWASPGDVLQPQRLIPAGLNREAIEALPSLLLARYSLVQSIEVACALLALLALWAFAWLYRMPTLQLTGPRSTAPMGADSKSILD